MKDDEMHVKMYTQEINLCIHTIINLLTEFNLSILNTDELKF